ncbi:MAG TPA: 50S ribosomal protein L29 [Bacteroidales bacterium]|nr:50S ribosomal protein L29 [Bacteroidales bacterium]
MKTAEIRELSLKELQERIENEEAQLLKLKLNHSISPLDNPMKITESRKNITRMKTILTERNRNENKKS